MPSSTASRSTAIASARSAGGPKTPGPASCMAPYPMRVTVRSSPIVNVPPGSVFVGIQRSSLGSTATATTCRSATTTAACRARAGARARRSSGLLGVLGRMRAGQNPRSNRVARDVKAAVIHENGPPEVLRYEEVADPDCPEGCVLVAVEAISIEGGDLLARASPPPASTPHVVGCLAAGQVVELGGGVEQFAIGDRVVTMNAAGSHASLRAVPAMSAWRIPDEVDAAHAACVPIAFGTAHECLFTAANLAPGQTALIHAGAGGVGMAAIQLAKQAGATVLATASSDQKLERLKEFGLDHGINYAER